MDKSNSIQSRFQKEVDPLNRAFHPLKAALYVLEAEDPHPQVAEAEALLQGWAETIAPRLAAESAPYQKIEAFNKFFFVELGFQQSFGAEGLDGIDLTRVMQARRGLSVSLALIYHDLSSRLGIPLQTMSYPGHLLFASAWLGKGSFLDPSDGCILGLGETRHRVELHSTKQLVVVRPEQLSVLSDRQLLERYLVMLKGVYLAEGQHPEALRVAEWRLSLAPQSLMARWERGLLLYELNRFREAQRDLGDILVRAVASRQDPRNLNRAWVCELLAGLSDPPKRH